MDKYTKLREQYTLFTYDKYEIYDNDNEIEIEYTFSIDGLSVFKPKWIFPKNKNRNININDLVMQKLFFSLGLVELISYWKITCSPNVVINAGFIDDEQILWWKKQYFFGLGEFFYTNGINANIDNFMTISSKGEEISGIKTTNLDFYGTLIPIGGGKDSSVTIEILKSDMDKNACYIINPRGATIETAKVAGFTDNQTIAVKRTLDNNMLELNKKGYLNGHTPFSALVAFSSIIVAYLHGKKYVALSNEASANESTVANSDVNHQYSKSFQFEKDFCDYEQKYINSGIKYFSLLRPLSEFQIAKYFAKQKKYHSIFKSCNAGSKQNIWCGNCPKCLFVYLILSPFLSKQELMDIFGCDLLEKENLIEIFEQLIGSRPEKPFECVGSRDEVNTAICITIDKYKKSNYTMPLLLKHYQSLSIYNEYKNKANPYNDFFDVENLPEDKFLMLLKKECFSD